MESNFLGVSDFVGTFSLTPPAAEFLFILRSLVAFTLVVIRVAASVESISKLNCNFDDI